MLQCSYRFLGLHGRVGVRGGVIGEVYEVDVGEWRGSERVVRGGIIREVKRGES